MTARNELPSLCPKETAIAIRGILKKSFPKCKFSVVTERGSMVSSVRISWTDGPTVKLVEALTSCFKAGSFDGMTDGYDYDRDTFLSIDGVMHRPGTRYIFTERKLSPDLANKCIAQVAAYWGGVEVLPVAVPGYFGYELQPAIYNSPVRADLDGYHNDWRSSIHRAAENRAEFARDAELLRAAIAKSGLSARRFATEIMGRNERSIRRWLAGNPMPDVVRDFLARYLENAQEAS